MNTLGALGDFVRKVDALVASGEPQVAECAARLMQGLVASDGWLPESMSVPDPQHYQQHLLYLDPQNRYSLVSFVWGPDQHTPIHDHTVWGVIGVLRGAEYSQRYDLTGNGPPKRFGGIERLDAGMTDIVSPAHGDVHRVCNAYADRTSFSIHLYGGNIGRIVRKVYDPLTGAQRDFISGYASVLKPFDPFAQ